MLVPMGGAVERRGSALRRRVAIIPGVRRRSRILLILGRFVVFLMVSASAGRIYSSVADERSAVTALVEDEARGDQAGMLGFATAAARVPRARRAWPRTSPPCAGPLPSRSSS